MSVLEKLQFGLARKLPLILQTETGECGLACLAMVASYHGFQTDLAGLRRRFSFSMKGASLEKLIQVAGELNLASRAIRVEVPDLAHLSTPCILHWRSTHFVVLKDVLRGHAVIHDPSRGVRNVSLAQLSEQFTGVALEFTPTSLFKPRRKPEQISTWEMMGKVVGLKGWLLQLFLLATAIEVATLLGPFFIQWVTDHALVTGDRELLATLTIGFLLLTLVQSGVGSIRGWAILVLSTTFNLQWLGNVFTHLTRLPILYFEKRHLGDVLNRFGVIQTIQNTLTVGFIEAIIDGLMAVGALVMMMIYSAVLALIGLVTVTMYATLRWVLYGAMRSSSYEEMMHGARQQTLFMETVRGIQSIRIYNRGEERVSRWLNVVVDQKNCNLRKQRLLIVFTTASSLLFGCAGILVIGFGALAVLDNKFSIGMLLAFAAYNDQFARRISSLVDKLYEFKLLEVQGVRLADIVLAKPESDTGARGAVARPAELAPSLEARNLRFRYADGEPLILDSCSFKLDPGEIVAITGPSGCGKTTLFKVLLGLLPASGDVLLGGASARQLGWSTYRDLLGVVMQDERLFAGTIADNISFFSADPDFDLIETCARQAAIHGDVGSLPMRYNTLIGDMGTVFSGGQKQRLFLARALYRRPKVLLLDEATNQLDKENESLVIKSVRELGITCLIAAHRPETIAAASRIIRLERGRMADRPFPQPHILVKKD